MRHINTPYFIWIKTRPSWPKPPWRIIVINILSIFPFQFLCCTSFPHFPFNATFSIYIILWLPHKFSNICKPEEGWYGQPKYCYKNNTRCFKSALQQSLDFSFLVLYILADLISFLEIQRLQLAGSSSTVFAVNLILKLIPRSRNGPTYYTPF